MRQAMLRAVKSSYLRPFLQGYSFDVTANSAVALVQGSDIKTLARTAAGKATIVPKMVGQRAPIVVGCPGEDSEDGAFLAYVTDATTKLYTFQNTEIDTGAFAGKVGTVHALTLGHDAMRTAKIWPEQTVKNRSASPRIMGFVVDPDGEEITYGSNQATLSVDASVSTITFERPFGRTPIAVAVPISDAIAYTKIESITNKAVVVSTFDDSGAAADVPFHLVVLGWDCYAEQTNMRRSLQSTQLRPRLEGIRVKLSGVTASVTVGSDIATVTRNGAGDYTVTLTKPFKQAPIALVTGKAHIAVLGDETDVDEITVLTFGADTNAADATFDLLLLGSDADNEV